MKLIFLKSLSGVLFILMSAIFFGNKLHAQNINKDSMQREMLMLPRPAPTNVDSGIVVIKIFVDREGNVASAEFVPERSTTANFTLIELARSAALKSKFAKKDDSPELQTGYITYNFTLN